jgi:hypothetical protein
MNLPPLPSVTAKKNLRAVGQLKRLKLMLVDVVHAFIISRTQTEDM